jgi:hypothetical protein
MFATESGDPMSDLTSETLLSLPEAARRIPPGRNGRPTHISTLVRWITRGVKVRGVGTVRLEALRCSSRWLTSAEALGRFFSAQTPTLGDTPALPRTPTARRRAADKAGEQLSKIGI